MAYHRFTKFTSTIQKGESEGSPVFIGGSRVRFIGIPTNEDGSSAMSGSAFTFRGQLENPPEFIILDYSGSPLSIAMRGQSVPHVPSGLAAAKALIPVKNGELFEGIATITPVSNAVEKETRFIDIHFEVSDS